MDYQEWLLNQYTVKIAALTYSDDWKKWVGYITAGTLIFSFGNVARLWIQQIVVDLLGEGFEEAYETQAADTIQPQVDSITDFLDGYNLGVVSNVIDLTWGMIDYLIVDVIFAYLMGDLTADTNYA